MPNIASAAKRMRSDVKKHLKNQSAVSELQTLYKRLVDLVVSSPEEAKKLARELVSKLDKAVSRGVIPHGRADRKKARIGRLFNKK